MREILFRGKRLDNSEWVEGSYLDFDSDSGYAYIIKPYRNASTLPLKLLIWDNMHIVDPETVGQYTGLQDKNGVKIFEGDILRYSYEYLGSPWLKSQGKSDDDIKYNIGAVFWQEWRGTWAVCSRGARKELNQDVYKYSRNPNRVEVIGNIYDNPDLLD